MSSSSVGVAVAVAYVPSVFELALSGLRAPFTRLGIHLQISGQLSPRLLRKLPPRVCVSLKSIVDEPFLCAG